MPSKPASLQIHSIPFKPSHLSIPPSPFSPLSPLTLTISVPRPQYQTQQEPRCLSAPLSFSFISNSITLTPPPPSPLQWVWRCHQCHRTYALGVTRRCLEDGHYFCAGTTTVKNWRKAISPKRVRSRHRACASGFDYARWKVWGRWRRSLRGDIGSGFIDGDGGSESPWTASPASVSSSDGEREALRERKSKGEMAPLRMNPLVSTQKTKTKTCWHSCDYPSECRWGRQFGVHTPLTPEQPPLPMTLMAPLPSPQQAIVPMAAEQLEGILKMEDGVKDESLKKEEWEKRVMECAAG
ncbi:hypothetical protein GQ43DRAFT_488634 [Delitschia confertaspora ATCC 74209]|uniref:Uncharacterized protein n=1 Tax=Delitschia confertaspora ATCC 74209 TaxID=1513339 RepID=A0A9P4MSA1_9PLEO|nr:hypothetical protein GQ43DRAFT_488634 [Delitschia confertaspora ATCC 74209]